MGAESGMDEGRDGGKGLMEESRVKDMDKQTTFLYTIARSDENGPTRLGNKGELRVVDHFSKKNIHVLILVFKNICGKNIVHQEAVKERFCFQSEVTMMDRFKKHERSIKKYSVCFVINSRFEIQQRINFNKKQEK